MNKTESVAIAIAAVSSLVAGSAAAQVHPEKPGYAHEKCYGVAKAGENDCGTAKNACGKTAKADGDPGQWIYVPEGTCARIVGGSLKPPA